MDQLKEVYGLDTIVVKELRKRFFVADNFIPQKININTVQPEGPKHPYIKWKEVQAIVAYRKQHGDLKSIDQLTEIKILSDEWIQKAMPYLTIEMQK
jgi:DNA uptake protein ComE-like DNA-binding protein